MEIVIGDKKVDIELKKENVRLEEVIDEVEQFLFSVGQIPVALKFNGVTLSQEELDKKSKEVLAGDEALNFGVIEIATFVSQNLEGAQQANQDLCQKIRAFSEEMQQSQQGVSGAEISIELGHFFEFWVRLQGLIPDLFTQCQIQKYSFNEALDQLRSLLEEIVSAMEAKDFVLSADLLNYEIMPIVEALNGSIPQMQQHLASMNKNDDSEENKGSSVCNKKTSSSSTSESK